MAQSKSLEQIEERMAGLEPGTIRHEALQAAKRFKSSWIELGRVLWAVYREKKFKEWGYLSFDAYCAKEIGIRSATAKKLLHSYYFLEREEPSLLRKLQQESPAKLPQADSVNMLRLLKNNEKIQGADYEQVRRYVLERGGEAPQVRKEIRSLLESAEPDPEAARADRRQAVIRRTIGTLKSLKVDLQESKLVPAKLLAEIESLVKKLEEVI